MDTDEDIELAPLARKLLEHGSARWLDCSLQELAEQCDDRRVREVFVALEGACHARSLREALLDDFFSDWVDQTCTISEIWSVIHQIRGWLGLVDPWEIGLDDVARLVDVASPPQSRKEITAWAQVHRVEDVLAHSMSVVAAETVRETKAMSVLDAAAGMMRGRPSQSEQYLQQRARAYLRAKAAFALAPAVRDRIWQRTASRVPVNLLAGRLRELISPFERSTLDGERFHRSYPVELDANSGTCQAMLRSQKITEVSLQLDGFEDSSLLGSCESCAACACVHKAALAARVLDACLDSQDRLHAAISGLTGVPSWQRLLTRLTQSNEANSSQSQLCYLVEWIDGQIYVGVLDRAAGAQLVAASKAQRRRGLSAQDRLALTALARCAKTLGPERVRVDLAALRTLQGRPCVQNEMDRQGLHLREERLTLRFEDRDQGMTPVLTLAGKQLGAPSPSEYVVEYGPEQRTLFFAALTPESQSAISSLLSYRGLLPKESLAALASWGATARECVDVVLPASVPSHEQPTPRKLLFRIEPLAAGGVVTSLGMQPFPLSPYCSPGEGEEVVYALQEGVLVHTRRDLAHERALAERVVAKLDLQQDELNESWQFAFSEERALRVLSQAARMVDEIDLEWVDHKRRKMRGPHKLRASDLIITFLKEGDWLKLQGTALVEKVQVRLEQLLYAARIGLRYIRIEGGSYIEIEETLLEQLEQAAWTAHLTRGEIRIILAAAKSWLEQFGDRITADDPVTAAWLADVRMGSIATTTQALSLSAQLRPYQADGARWLMRCSDWAPGACLADEMGLGKTIQAISVLNHRIERGPALIVAPTSLITNWISEIARFAPTLRTQIYHGPARSRCELEPGTVTVTSYDIVLRDDNQLAQAHFATLVLDEAQVIRNPETKRAKALRKLRADFRIALTGTPIENRVGDLWSIFQVVAPGLLGTRGRFRPLLAVPVDRYRNARRAQLIVLRLDLEDFFISIRGARVRAIFRRLGYPEPVARTLAGLCCTPTPEDVIRIARPTLDFQSATRMRTAHLAQGAPTSPALSNLACFRLDRRLRGLARAAGASYTRYADDLAFSGGREFQRGVARFIVHASAIALEEGFRVRHRKTRVMRAGGRQRLAGVVVNDRVNVGRDEYDRLRALLYNAARFGPDSQNHDGHADFRAHLLGRISWIAASNPVRGAKLTRDFNSIEWSI
ncbi:MAG TPA: SNF2-related protein [Polyangiales bacterium]|nr:SNF2-related protein [Polyangiales bacterium]